MHMVTLQSILLHDSIAIHRRTQWLRDRPIFANGSSLWISSELKKQIAELDLKSHITFTGHRNDLKEIISISTIIYSLSSVPESFGRTTLEALSIGRPVIGYSHGGVQEQLEQIFPEGLISVGSIQKAISTTNLFLNKVPILQPQRTFTLDSMCSQTLSIYQELCNG